MITVATIVEGDGEVAALPVLLRRLGVWLSPALTFDIPPPIRVRSFPSDSRAEGSRQTFASMSACRR